MRKYLLVFILLSFLISCADSGRESIKEDKDAEVVYKEKPAKEHLQGNSLIKQSSHLDSSMTMIEAAEKILVGENYNRWNDTYLLSLIDSLNSINKTKRKYYFKVFNKIMEKADGYVSEAIGMSALKYTSNHTQEFINWSKELKPVQFDSWAYHVGVEISLSNVSNGEEVEDLEKGMSYAKLLRENCKTCDKVEKKRLENFIAAILQTVERVSE